MKKFKLLFIYVLFLFPFIISAQDCSEYFPVNEGAIIEMKSYNEKDKLQSESKMTILEKRKIGNGYNYKFEFDSKDAKGKDVAKGVYEARCEDGVFYIDFSKFVPQEQMKGMENMEMKIESDQMEFPSNPQPGMKLKDSHMKMEASVNGMSLMTMNFETKDRKIEALEKITTPAGTFDCVKISYTMELKSMFNMTTESIEWYAPGMGMVRSEQYKKGKLEGYSVLTNFKE